MSTPAGTRLVDYDGTFFSGSKSDSDPAQLPLGYAWMTVNMLNVGGLLSTRPGYKCIVTLPDGNLQGLTIFRPIDGLESLVTVIDGVVYTSEYPFTAWSQLPNIQLSPTARVVYWAQTYQSAERITQDVAAAIRVIPTKAILFIQDNGLSAPAWWDGSNSGQVRGIAFNTPSGGAMAWSGNRLWVANENRVFASDISNPFSFREQNYLGGLSAFFFLDTVTAMINTPSVESPQLMVFTPSDCSIVQSNIQDRTQWPTTVNFQEQVLQVGTNSHRSVVAHFGRLVWFAESGVAMFDPALSGKITSRLPTRDNEMLFSKSTLNDDLSGVAAGTFGQFLLMSVPAEDAYNKHTWVLNHASMTTLSDDSGPSWAGFWLGTRPVEWATGLVAGVERVFHVSVDVDGKNRLWEAFQPTRFDNGCPITWAVFTRGYFGQTDPVQDHPPGSRCRLAWADLAFSAIEEDLNLGVFYAGGTRGAFRPMLNKLISVARGSLSYDQEFDATTAIYGFKSQSRVVRTEDVNQQETNPDESACPVELPDLDNIDRSFQLLIVGQGAATLRWVRPIAFSVPEDLSGDGAACTDEVPFNAVRFDGVGLEAPDLATAISELNAIPLNLFMSNQTVTVDQSGFFAVGVGASQSIISQEAADRVALVIATRQAEFELQSVVPPTTSIGLGLENVG